MTLGMNVKGLICTKTVQSTSAMDSEMTQNDSPVSTDLFLPLIKNFVSSLSKRLGKIREAMLTPDLPRLESLAHQLKGTASSFGFEMIADTASKLETLAGRKGLQPNDIFLLFKELENRCHQSEISFANGKITL